MRNLVFSASLLALSACGASAGAGTTAAPPPVVDAPTTATTMVRTRTDVAAAESIEAPMQRVWDALPAVYQELGVTDLGQDPGQRTFGNGRIIANRTFAGERLSRYLNCGNTAFGAPVADESRVEMSLRTSVAAEGQGTSVRTILQATARSNRGTSTDAVPCNSTGRLESRIATMLRQRLAS